MTNVRLSNRRPSRINETGFSVEFLDRLYQLTDWRVAITNNAGGTHYNEFPVVSLCKALCLPLLVPIASQRGLSKAIRDEPFRTICGFTSRLPTRSTLWYFAEDHPTTVISSFIALADAGLRLDLPLPYVETPARGEEGIDNSFRITFDAGATSALAWHPPVEQRDGQGDTQAQLFGWNETPHVPREALSRDLDELGSEVSPQGAVTPKAKKRSLSQFLGLPVRVRVDHHDFTRFDFEVAPPAWLKPDFAKELFGIDSLIHSRRGGRSRSIQSTQDACNILVPRTTKEGHTEVLIAQRKRGLGAGSYALPGGKVGLDEDVQAAAVRELWEEASLSLLQSRPISVRRTHIADKPPTWSIGVLAEEYSGSPIAKEDMEWEWVDLRDLPFPLFLPARFAIEDYLKGTLKDLRWDAFEVYRSSSIDSFDQLHLGV